MRKALLIGCAVVWLGFNAWFFLFSNGDGSSFSTAEDAEAVLADALTQAATQDKAVLVHIGAPWCGWCHKLDDFLEAERAVLEQDFVMTAIDTDTMVNDKIVASRLRGSGHGGIPWMAILDLQGNIVVTSDGPQGNIGYPCSSSGIDYFISMLQKLRNGSRPSSSSRLGASLKREVRFTSSV